MFDRASIKTVLQLKKSPPLYIVFFSKLQLRKLLLLWCLQQNHMSEILLLVYSCFEAVMLPFQVLEEMM